MNIRDIARIANVTPGTVSKVLNNYPDISEATRQHVIQVINEYQYKPTVGSKATHNFGKKPTIGIITEGVHNALSKNMEDQVSIRLHNEDFTMVYFNDNYYTQDKVEKFEEVLAYADNHSLIGLVYVGGNFAEVPKELFDKLSCPTVFVNTVLPISFGETNYSSVNCNNFETGYHQMQSLIKAGHRNIAMMISSIEDNSIYGLRVNGYRAALAEAGIKVDASNIVIGDYQITKSYINMRAYLEKHPETTAICISADVMASGVVRAAYELGRKPGVDLEIVSADGLEITEFLIPSITTYALPKSDMVTTVYDLIVGLIDGSKQHQHIIFNTKRIERESTKH